MSLRAVFDTNTVISALLFAHSRLAWLRSHWRSGECTPLISRATAAELNRVLQYPKFKLTYDERLELLGDYIPFCEIVDKIEPCRQQCRDPHDQAFLDLAFSGQAEVLITGDADLLALAGTTRFAIETPESYRKSQMPEET